MQKVSQQTDRLSQTSHSYHDGLWINALSGGYEHQQAKAGSRKADYSLSMLEPVNLSSMEIQTNITGNVGSGTGSAVGQMARGTSAPGAPTSRLYDDNFNRPASYSLPMTRRHSFGILGPEFSSQMESFGLIPAPADTMSSHDLSLERNSSQSFRLGPTTAHSNLQDMTNLFRQQAQYASVAQRNPQRPFLFNGGHLPSAKNLETPTAAEQWSYENMVGLDAHQGAYIKSSLHPSFAPTPTASELTVESAATSDMSRQSSILDPLLRDSSGFAQAQPGMLAVPVTSCCSSSSSSSSSSSYSSSSPSLLSFNGECPPLFQSSSSVRANDSAVSLTNNERFPSVTVANSNVGCNDFTSLPSFPMSLDCSQEGADHVVEEFVLRVPSSVSSVVCADSSSISITSPVIENVQKARPIAPKAPHHEETLPQASSKNNPLAPAQRATKRAISKAPYVRRVQPKKMCPRCIDHPEGFRGDHELRRHIKRAHSTVRSMWICVDTSADQTFLAHCKACRSGKKYAADYNAAAHLRRTHFNARKRGYGRGKTNQKRGGMGGGDKPPMEELRKWMKEVEEIATDNLKDDLESDQDDDDDEDDCSEDFEISTSFPPAFPPFQAPIDNAKQPEGTPYFINNDTSCPSSSGRVPPGFESASQQPPSMQFDAADLTFYSGSAFHDRNYSAADPSTALLGQNSIYDVYHQCLL